ncbi:histidine kinase [Cellulomonas sp. zg-ZUI222]|uniref:histidine kinase n=1 Tax=Cellulomonas wangleii TaxID=2816956 RepID=UPI001A940EAF|nr:histidine kinase [Cellulomonas wangleii]MBO0920214.1 histidine kinase [Cellulomonas wangleii]
MPDTPRPADDAHDDTRQDVPAPTAPAGPPPAAPGTPDEAPGTPDEAELARVAVPATVRRAPRYGAFLVAGALVGMVVGLVVAALTSDGSSSTADGGVLPFLGGENGVRWLLALSLGIVGALVGGVLALLADRRSTRGRRAAPPA